MMAMLRIEKLENKEGTVVLSHEKAEFKKNWDASSRFATKAAASWARSRPSSKAVWLSMSASRRFCRRRRLTSSRRKICRTFVGNTYEFKVVKINQERQNIVLSRRELIEAERNDKRGKIARRDGSGRHPQGHGQEHHGFRRVH
jgi:small subunit ribosomal protein S1